jgi:hypothetical protein
VLTIIDLIALGICVALVIHRRRDESSVQVFVRSLAPLPLEKREAALRLASACNRLPEGPDPVFLPVFFEALGATATAVIERGGCCSGRSRLLILALAELDISAFQITLYHRAGHAQHCLVQASIDGEPLILDPSYGISYSSPDGTPVGLQDLQKGVTPHHDLLPDVSAGGYPENCYYEFDYTLSRTANWTCSPWRRCAYRALCLCVGRRIDNFGVPASLEWPQHLFIALALGSVAVIHLLVALSP